MSELNSDLVAGVPDMEELLTGCAQQGRDLCKQKSRSPTGPRPTAALHGGLPDARLTRKLPRVLPTG